MDVAERHVAGFTRFAMLLMAEPEIKIAVANRSLMPPQPAELYVLFLTLLSDIGVNESGGEGAELGDNLLIGAKRLDVSLVKVVWASQFKRRMESGSFLDMSTLSDEELQVYFRTGLH